jgi:hypothetical protein
MKLLPRFLHSPALQLLAATGVMVAGAWLIALWMVGIVLMLAGAYLGLDAVFRDTAQAERSGTVSARERWRRAA